MVARGSRGHLGHRARCGRSGRSTDLSVFTPVTEREAAAWLSRYSVGALAALEPIAAGIENTNYFLSTAQGRYVLTLFERLPAAELPFYLELMAHLARHGIPCPAPVADLSDRYLSTLNGKPAALVTRLSGASIERPGAAECAQLGELLARMHLAARSFTGYLENPRGARDQFLLIGDTARPLMDGALADAGLEKKDVDFLACHQASAWLPPAVAEHTGLEHAKRTDTFTWAASLSGANLPLVMAAAERENAVADGDLVAMYSGAAGMTASAMMFRWGR